MPCNDSPRPVSLHYYKDRPPLDVMYKGPCLGCGKPDDCEYWAQMPDGSSPSYCQDCIPDQWLALRLLSKL